MNTNFVREFIALKKICYRNFFFLKFLWFSKKKFQKIYMHRLNAQNLWISAFSIQFDFLFMVMGFVFHRYETTFAFLLYI